jgi:sulfate adenylyltransferase
MTSHLVPPHGGRLVDLMASPLRAAELVAHAKEMASWSLAPRQLADLELLLSGAFSPLRGFMGSAEAESARRELRLGDGTFWPAPVTLEVSEDVAKDLGQGRSLALRDGEGILRAVLQVGEVWRGKDPATPAGTVSVAGLTEGVEPPHHYDFVEIRATPAAMREQFARWGWRRVAAFHTAEVMHRAEHELTLAAARELEASLLVQLGVATDSWWDAGHYSRIRCLQALMKAYPPGTAQLNLLPLAPREAGARDLLLNAVVAQNYGCSHFVVRGSAAGAGDETIARAAGGLQIKLVRVPERVYSSDKGAFVAEDGVAAGTAAKTIPPAELAERLAWGREIPAWFSFPEVLQELRRSRPPRSRQGFTVFFTGLPSSGKSTLANVLMVKLLQMGGRPVTLLDGDIVRKHLSSELGFSREHRNLNIARIGFVASEITKNNGIALCAPIAPYDSVRKQVRAMIEPHGGFLLVHVATPIAVCEQRDRKGLYAKARAGIVKEFTGVSDPYEEPQDAGLAIDTSERSPEECVQAILLHLEKEGYIGPADASGSEA